MAKDVLHVVPHEEAWAVKREGNERASSTHETQRDAIEAARELAKERDDIVVHRPDGTIRERVTYFGSANGGGGTEDGGTRRGVHSTEEGRAEVSDLVGVASRVSWGAILAGVVTALTVYLTLSFLALAIGLSTMDRASDRTFNTTAAAISALIILVSMFVGGLVASRATAGENRTEGAAYGLLVWGTTVIVLALAGLGVAGDALRGLSPTAAAPIDAQRMQQELGLSAQQVERYAAMARDARASSPDADQLAWWTFAAIAVSIMSAVGGGLVGAGPGLYLVGSRETAAVAVPRPA